MILIHSKVVVTEKRKKGMTTYYTRGSTIWLNYYVDGKRIQKSTKLKNTLKNISIVEKQIIPSLDIKIATGEIYKKKPKTFEFYANKFLKLKDCNRSYLSKVNKWKRVINFFATRDIDSITRLDIKEYLNSLDIKSSSKSPYKSCIKEVFELAVDDGVISFNPAINIRLKEDIKKPIDYYTKEEVNIILSEASGILKLYLLIAFNTGMRSGEVLGLQIGDFKNGYIHIRRTRTKGIIGTGKTSNAIRKVPYPAFILDEVKKMQPKDNIFLFGNIDDSGKLDYMWRQFMLDSEIPRYRLYCTRHTYATLMLKDKIVSINELAGLLGHSSSKITLDRYASVIDTEYINIEKNFSLFCDESVTVDRKRSYKAQ